jgi:hypothetical protein
MLHTQSAKEAGAAFPIRSHHSSSILGRDTRYLQKLVIKSKEFRAHLMVE